MKHLCKHHHVYVPNLAILLGIACSCMPVRQAVGNDVEAMVGGSVASNSLSLRAATELALTNNPDLAARSADVRGAGERVKALSAARWPSIGLSGSYSEYLDNVRLAPASYNGEPGTFGADFLEGGLTLRLPLYTGGKLTSDIRAADLLAQSEEGLLARSRGELIFNVRLVFYAMLAQVHLIESVEFSVQAIDEHLKRVNELVEAQKAARVDALRTEVRSSELRQQLIEAQNALAIQKRVLANLLGTEAAALPPLEGRLELAEPEVCPGPSDCMGAALKQRADYRAANLATQAAETAVRAARGDRLPSISLSGAYGYRWAVDPAHQADGADDGQDIGRVGVVAEFPLFEGGRLKARVRESKESLNATRERERSLRLRIQREVDTARLNVSAARQRVDLARAGMTQAEESLRIERQKYELGKGAIVDVLDAQSALLQSQTSNYRALADLNVSIGEFDLAMGKETSR